MIREGRGLTTKFLFKDNWHLKPRHGLGCERCKSCWNCTNPKYGVQLCLMLLGRLTTGDLWVLLVHSVEETWRTWIIQQNSINSYLWWCWSLMSYKNHFHLALRRFSVVYEDRLVTSFILNNTLIILTPATHNLNNGLHPNPLNQTWLKFFVLLFCHVSMFLKTYCYKNIHKWTAMQSKTLDDFFLN